MAVRADYGSVFTGDQQLEVTVCTCGVLFDPVSGGNYNLKHDRLERFGLAEWPEHVAADEVIHLLEMTEKKSPDERRVGVERLSFERNHRLMNVLPARQQVIGHGRTIQPRCGGKARNRDGEEKRDRDE